MLEFKVEFKVGDERYGFRTDVEGGLPMKVESLAVASTFTSWRVRRVWVGRGGAPRRYVPWVEWVLRRFGVRRWRAATYGEGAVMVRTIRKSRRRRFWELIAGSAP